MSVLNEGQGKRPKIDPKTGQIDLKYNQLSNDQDYFLATYPDEPKITKTPRTFLQKIKDFFKYDK
jgi:hypothetical protein